MSILDSIKAKAKEEHRTVVFPEGNEPRSLTAAACLIAQEITNVILIGNRAEIEPLAGQSGLDLNALTIIEPSQSEYFDQFVDLILKKRKAKGMTKDEAVKCMKEPLFFGAALVKTGHADASVAGAVNTTGAVLRAALQVIGLADGIKTLSSSFMMTLPEFQSEKNKLFMFADCAVLPNPNPEQLASIAASTSDTLRKLVGIEPKVAFLSFSTKGSAKHKDIDKVVSALEIFRKNYPDIEADGEMQLDAAIIPAIGQKKAPDSKVAGQANVLIFPDLDAGNIGYKLVERMAGAIATGPIIQGLAAPANDLSRGCSADDIVDVSAIAVLMKD